MIKLVQCIKARPDDSVADFRRNWRQYRDRFRALAQRFGVDRVDFSTTLSVDANLELMFSRGTRQPYDGMVEAYFPNASVLATLTADDEFQAGLVELQGCQEMWFNLAASTFFFAVDEED